MSDYIIATSSTSDLTRDYLDAHSIPFVSYSYTIGDKLYEDDCREESRDAVYKGMRNNGDLLKTSMINEYIYCDFFNSLLDSGKDVIFLDMSKKMSVSYEKALIGAEMACKEHPDRKLYVMDTLCISGGLGLLVMNMVRRKEAGAGFDEVVAWGEENKLRIAHRFTVDDLNYLKEGGRVSNSAALVGSILDIKPVLYVPNAGTLDVAQKVRGRKASLNALIDKIGELGIAPEKQTMFICHGDCYDDAKFVADYIRERSKVQDIIINYVGPVIGSHTGPGVVSVFFLGTER